MRLGRWAGVLAVCAVLFAGLTNAHAHVRLCLDGRAHPSSVQTLDGSDHFHEHADDHHADGHGADHLDDDHATGDHDDVDLDVPNAALAKKVAHDLPAIVPIAALAVPIADETSSTLAPTATIDPKPPPPFSRPLLRAPPP